MSIPDDVPFERTLHVRDTCLCLHARRAARALARRFDEAFAPLGITNGQFSLLASLNRPEPASMNSVSSLLGMDRTSLTALLKPLERQGLVAIDIDREDRRRRRLRLTRKGRRLLGRALSIWEHTHAEVESSLAGTPPDALRRSLRSLEVRPRTG